MSMELFTPRNGVQIARPRTVSRQAMRRGLEMASEEWHDAMIETREIVNLYLEDPGMDGPVLYRLQRYTSNSDGDQFKKGSSNVPYRQWPEVNTLQGIIIGAWPYRIKRQSMEFREDEPNPIECTSPNLTIGIGNPGGGCMSCELQSWDISRSKGLRHPPCSDRVRIFVRTLEYAMPVVIDLIGSHRRHFNDFTDKARSGFGIPPWAGVCDMSLRLTGDSKSVFTAEPISYLDTTREDVIESINETGRGLMAMIAQEAYYTIYGAYALEPEFDPQRAAEGYERWKEGEREYIDEYYEDENVVESTVAEDPPPPPVKSVESEEEETTEGETLVDIIRRRREQNGE